MKPANLILFTGLLCAVLSAGHLANQTKDLKAEVALQAAIKTETVDGNLKGAIEQYQKLANGSNHVVAAKALIRLGQCYEKLGDTEARKAYERVVREFADQKEAVEQARVLLAAGGRERQIETGLAVQQKWVLPPGRKTQMRHVSADGRYIPFQTSYSLWLHDLITGEDRKVIEAQTGEYLYSPELSPDGKQIVFTRSIRKNRLNSSELRVADIDGSRMRVLMKDQVRPPLPKAWSPDGKRILILMQNATEKFSLALVSVADGSAKVLTTGDDFSNGCFSPDGKYIVTYRGSVDSGQPVRVPAGLTVIPVDGSGAFPLFESTATNWAPFWTPDGRRIVFLSDRSGTIDLWSILVSGGRAEAEPELVKPEAGSIDLDPIGFTRDGLFYYKTSSLQSDIYAADLDPETGRIISKPVQINQRFVGSVGGPIGPMAWSPDGQFLAYTRISRRELGYPVSKTISIIIRSEKTREEREISSLPAFNQDYPKTLIWLPDGRSLLADNYAKGFLFHQIDVQTGQVKEFLALSGNSEKVYYPVLSPDGKTLLYVQYDDKSRSCRLMRRSLESGEVRELYQTTGPELDDLALSSDGRQLAFAISDWDQETFSLMIMLAEGGEVHERLKSKLYIDNLAWMRDGRNLLMVRESESGPPQLWSVPIDGGEPHPSGLVMRELYSIPVHPDGRRIAFFNNREPQEEVWVIKNLLSTPKTSR